jgi:hypothetical protein
MLPPGVHYFVYSVNKEVYIDSSSPMVTLSLEESLNIMDQLEKQGIKTPYGISQLNYTENLLHKEAWLDKDTYEVLIKHCIPRPGFEAEPADFRPRTPWTLEISLFKDYRPEYKELVVKCFEFDWKTISKPKFKVSTE